MDKVNSQAVLFLLGIEGSRIVGTQEEGNGLEIYETRELRDGYSNAQ